MVAGVFSLITAIGFILYGLFRREDAERTAEKWAHVPDPVKKWVPLVQDQARKYGVPPRVALAILWKENRGKMLPDGDAGEKGIMQLKKIAWQDLRLNGFAVPSWDQVATSPRDNIITGIKFLALQQRRTGNWQETIRAYNQGYEGKDETPAQAERANEYLSDVNTKIELLAA